LREDRYFIVGQAIAVSLVNGGPPPGFISPTLYSQLLGGNSSVKPVLSDIADNELYEKVKKVSECTSFEDLISATEPLQDCLANAGCLRQLKKVEDKDLLVQDILMFQVVHRVTGAFERVAEAAGAYLQRSTGERRSTPLTCHQSIAGHDGDIQDNHAHTHSYLRAI
ncbi:hypothetical protein GOODEAATRI_033292, partial [Goodea atripinnis]